MCCGKNFFALHWANNGVIMESNLLAAARREMWRCIFERNLSISDIADGAGVAAPWLRLWWRGKIPNPGAVLIQRVYDYCKKQ